MTISGVAKLILLMIRCEYLTGRDLLTRKGLGYVSPSIWRLWNRILCLLKPGHKKAVVELLTHFNAPLGFKRIAAQRANAVPAAGHFDPDAPGYSVHKASCPHSHGGACTCKPVAAQP